MGEAVGCVTKAVDLALRIKDAVDTVRQNRKDCAHIRRRVERVRHTLSLCEGNAELMGSPAVCDAVEALAEVLSYALELVTGCQEETNAVCLYCTAGKVSKQLGKVDRGISDGNSEATFAILVFHISKQTRDGAGPAMPTATDQERWSLQIEEQIELHSRGKSKNHTITRAATMPSHQRGRDRHRHPALRTLVRPTKKLRKAATTTNMARVPEDAESRQHIPSEGEEDDYGSDVAWLQEIARATLAITTATETVRRNKDECIQIDKIAIRVGLLLPQLEHTETTKDGGVRRALNRLLKTFLRAHKLVVACQRRSVVVLCSPGKLSGELRGVLDEMMLRLDDLIDALL
uniref:Uncharacterized protein n=1 Tax=Avena sativa TaxID=4498 RepID=A0ACD5TEJ8_AVESA